MERVLKTAFAREAAAGGMVLLKNDNGVLPLAKDARVALFGRPSYYVFRMGSGSGDMLAQPPRQIYEGLEDAGITVHAALKEHSLRWHNDNIGRLDIINRNWFEWTNIMPEIPLEPALVDAAAVAAVHLGDLPVFQDHFHDTAAVQLAAVAGKDLLLFHISPP